MQKIISQKILPDNSSISILIVDDDPIVLEVMKSFIASYGYTFATALDGLLAIEKLKTQQFSIVITDINMPNMDGMELLKYVRQHYPSTGVIVCTGLSEEYAYVDVINAGAIDYMAKPFDGQELLAKLQRVIREQTLMNELEKMSICDALTGIYNRRHFDTKLAIEVHRAVRQNYPVVLSLIDVDNFKGYNDTYGHQAGDNLLATIGKVLLNNARKNVDYAFRYGGDEFAMLITETDKEQAIKISERIKSSFDQYQFAETSLSFGLALLSYQQDISREENLTRFIKLADDALYEAKNSGKNSIVCL